MSKSIDDKIKTLEKIDNITSSEKLVLISFTLLCIALYWTKILTENQIIIVLIIWGAIDILFSFLLERKIKKLKKLIERGEITNEEEGNKS